MYRSQDKARKEEYEEETSAKTNLNRLEPLYVLLCVRIFRRFSISFICLGSACHSILDLRESKLYQRTMKQPFDKMSNMEENIVIFLFVLHVVSNILLFHFVSFFIWTIWKAAWAWHMQIYLRLWFIYKYMYIKRVVCCSLVRIRIFHVENLSLDVVFLRFDSIAREMMISCFIPCLVSLFIDSICFFFERIGHWFDWVSMSKSDFDHWQRKRGSGNAAEGRAKHREREKEMNKTFIACCTRASGRHPQKQPENDKLNETWHVNNFSFDDEANARDRAHTTKPSSVWNVISLSFSFSFSFGHLSLIYTHSRH